MPTITNGAIFQINLDGRLFGQQVLLTTCWKIQVVDPSAAFDDDALFTELNVAIEAFDGFATQYMNCLSEQVIGVNAVYQVLHPQRYIKRVKALLTQDGQQLNPSMPPNVSHVVTLRTEVAGRDQLGNKHITGVPVPWSENGIPTAPALLAYEGLGEALVTDMTVTVDTSEVTVAPVILRRSSIVNSPYVNNFVVGRTTRVERRRTVGLGS